MAAADGGALGARWRRACADWLAQLIGTEAVGVGDSEQDRRRAQEECERLRTEEGCRLLLKSQTVLLPLAMCARLVEVEHGEDCLLLLRCLVYTVGQLVKPVLLRRVARDPLKWGNAVQLVAATGAVLWRTAACIRMTPGVNQHRAFISFATITLIVFALVAHVPDKFWFGWIGPVWTFCNLAFNYFVGMGVENMAPSLAIFTVCSYLRYISEQAQWQKFCALSELRRERKSLKEARACLHRLIMTQHNILRLLLDASCTCDRDGRLTYVSAQMQAILCCPGSPGSFVGLPLTSFAATPLEEHRIQEFLASACSQAAEHAVMMQVSLRRRCNACCYAEEFCGTCRSHSSPRVEVKLMVISQPDVQELGLDKDPKMAQELPTAWHRPGIFVGFQLVQPAEVFSAESESESQASVVAVAEEGEERGWDPAARCSADRRPERDLGETQEGQVAESPSASQLQGRRHRQRQRHRQQQRQQREQLRPPPPPPQQQRQQQQQQQQQQQPPTPLPQLLEPQLPQQLQPQPLQHLQIQQPQPQHLQPPLWQHLQPQQLQPLPLQPQPQQPQQLQQPQHLQPREWPQPQPQMPQQPQQPQQPQPQQTQEPQHPQQMQPLAQAQPPHMQPWQQQPPPQPPPQPWPVDPAGLISPKETSRNLHTPAPQYADAMVGGGGELLRSQEEVMSLLSECISSIASISSVSEDVWVGRCYNRRSVSLSLLRKCPRDAHGRMLSLGSCRHASSACLPCKFLASSRGCKEGPLCLDCHYPHGEMSHAERRRRKKAAGIAKRALFDDGAEIKQRTLSKECRVKNTFLHVSSDSDEAPPCRRLRRTVSEPPGQDD